MLEEHGGIRCNSGNGEDQHLQISVKKQNPTEADSDAIVALIYAASEGDLYAIRRLVARGINLAGADYDLRTPLHLAAAEGHEHVVRYFIDQGLDLFPCDRWGGTPLGDAKRHGHSGVIELLDKDMDKSANGPIDK